jgi:hypothetical protein
MRQALITASVLALMATATSSAGTANGLHDDAHPIGIAAWEIDDVAVERRDERLSETGPTTPLPVVQDGDRVMYLVRVVDQTGDADLQLNFNSPGHAYVLGSASGGSCEAPAEAAPGIFQHSCTVSVGDDGSGDLFVTYEITATSDQDCENPAGEPDVVTLVVSEPIRAASDLRLCAGEAAAPAATPAPAETPAAGLPDTAMAADSAGVAPPNAIIGIAAVLLFIGSLVPLLRRP